jgi:hypothetical protein
VIELNLATSGAIMWALLQTISALTVLKFLRPLLRQSPR